MNWNTLHALFQTYTSISILCVNERSLSAQPGNSERCGGLRTECQLITTSVCSLKIALLTTSTSLQVNCCHCSSDSVWHSRVSRGLLINAFVKQDGEIHVYCVAQFTRSKFQEINIIGCKRLCSQKKALLTSNVLWRVHYRTFLGVPVPEFSGKHHELRTEAHD